MNGKAPTTSIDEPAWLNPKAETTEQEMNDLDHPETPLEHYLHAEYLASCVPDWWALARDRDDEKMGQHARDIAQLAQVHATLALFTGDPT